MENKFDWIPFYEELADKLLEYKDKRNELFEIMKNLVSKHTKLEYLHFERDDWWSDRNYCIDPFSIFATFSRALKPENRTEIANLYVEQFNLKSKVPTEFDGIPTMNNQNAFFGGTSEIWELFQQAIIFANTGVANEELFSSFENAVNAKGNGLATITMGLFWMRPYKFLNLDGQNRAFLNNEDNDMKSVVDIFPKIVKGFVPTGEEYISMCNQCQVLFKSGQYPFSSFPEMSHFAWSNGVTESNKTLATLVCLYYARLHSSDEEYKTNCSNDMKKASEVSGIKYNTLKQYKDTFDPYFDNGRKGYYQQTIEKKNKNLYDIYTNYKETSKEELKDIIDKFLLSYNSDKVFNDESISKKRYWLYSPGEQARLWDEFYQDKIMGIGWDDLGDLEDYSSREEIITTMRNLSGEEKSFKNDSLASWQFANSMNVGDVVIVKRGYSTVLGRGIVTSEYIYDETRNEYKHTRKIDWTHKGEWEHPGQAVQKTLTDITQYTEYVEKLETLFTNDGEIIEDDEVTVYLPYTKENFLSQVYMSEENYETLTTLLSRKKNIILQGAPGVGKTYAAKRLAYSIMGERDTSRVEMIQFHQSYAYEDFIMGYRPDNSGFKLHYGAFYKFCKEAQDDNERDYFFIIDEINRGNLSKIFGELFMLIEHDKRDERNSMRLLYADEQFYIPSNVHIIGMMNTADRSLAMLDYALRRRFAFFEIEPAFNSDGFKNYQENISNPKFDKLIEVIKQLNNVIKDDVSLGGGFRIGHSYFISSENDVIDDAWLQTVVNYEIVPLLQEYWFDENSRVEEWTAKLRGAIV